MMNANRRSKAAATVSCRPARQRGFSIVTAIFLLVVLSFLGVAMVTFSTTQHQSSAMDVMGSRAYQAARAGVEWAAYQVTHEPAPATCARNFAAGELGGVLSPFAVAVTCNATTYNEGAPPQPVWVYEVTATATTVGAAGDTGYVARVIRVKLGGAS